MTSASQILALQSRKEVSGHAAEPFTDTISWNDFDYEDLRKRIPTGLSCLEK
jgi:hypothetical protein